MRSFYTTETFGALDQVILERVMSFSEIQDTTYIVCEDTRHLNVSSHTDPWILTGETGFSFLTNRKASSEHPRCLYVISDLENPNILVCLCCWKEYLPLIV